MKTPHTPTPWNANNGTRNKVMAVYAPSRGSVCEMTRNMAMTDDEQNANAAFIVRACNAHDELVGLVSQILEQGLINDPEFYIEAVKILAKAKVE